jgi:hypothetical protein
VAYGTNLTSRSRGHRSSGPYAAYLRSLGTHSFKLLEDRTVNDLLEAFKPSPSNKSILPIRLSDVVERFLIRPRPQVEYGSQDGEIEFDETAGQFIIKLYSTKRQLTLVELAHQDPRLRFTYAHEVAHRFCYVPVEGRWLRARDLVTTGLARAEQLRFRVTLGQKEEGFCNSVARRVLIPDELIGMMCPVGEWFQSGIQFFSKLSEAAVGFGVSRDCLLVRLQTSSKVILPQADCAMIVGASAGPITQRGRRTLRLMTGLVGSSLADDHWYPGLEVAELGDPFARTISSILADSCDSEGQIDVPMKFRSLEPLRLKGWFHLLPGPDELDRRILVWGRLNSPG